MLFIFGVIDSPYASVLAYTQESICFFSRDTCLKSVTCFTVLCDLEFCHFKASVRTHVFQCNTVPFVAPLLRLIYFIMRLILLAFLWMNGSHWFSILLVRYSVNRMELKQFSTVCDSSIFQNNASLLSQTFKRD